MLANVCVYGLGLKFLAYVASVCPTAFDLSTVEIVFATLLYDAVPMR